MARGGGGGGQSSERKGRGRVPKASLLQVAMQATKKGAE